MTREEMVKKHWKPYSIVLYQDKGMKFPAECLLSGIDFDAEILTLTPIDDFYEQNEFRAAIQFCSIPKRIKAVAINDVKVKEPNDNFIMAKKIGMGDYFEDNDNDDFDKAS